MAKKSMLIVLAVAVASATLVPQAFASCFQCDLNYQCVSGFNYGGQACQQRSGFCQVWIPCAGYEAPSPDGLPPKIIRTSCKGTLLPNGQRVSLKKSGVFNQFVSSMNAGEFSDEGTLVFMGRDIYRRLPTINWNYVSDKEVSYKSKTGYSLRGHLYHVTTESGSKVDVVVVG